VLTTVGLLIKPVADGKRHEVDGDQERQREPPPPRQHQRHGRDEDKVQCQRPAPIPAEARIGAERGERYCRRDPRAGVPEPAGRLACCEPHSRGGRAGIFVVGRSPGLGQRELSPDLPAAVRLGPAPQLSSSSLDPLAHPVQAMPGALRDADKTRTRRRVAHQNPHLGRLDHHRHVGFRRSRVLHDVGKRLLDQSVERVIDRSGQTDIASRGGDPHRETGRPAQFRQRHDSADTERWPRGRGRGVHHAQDLAQLGQRRPARPDHFGQRGAGHVRLIVHGDPGQSGLHDHHADAVRHDVVQFPGDPVPFPAPGHCQAGRFPGAKLLGRRRQTASQ
jgi:hypothetical protein